MKRIKIVVQYVGTNYAGWQVQKNEKTVQGEIEQALFNLFNQKIEVFASGRTDAGVHAFMQVAHFDCETKMPAEKIFYALNAHLPDDIKILSSCEVSKDFHARFNAKKKTYEYNFYTSFVNLPILDTFCTKISTNFDFKIAKKACRYFVGTFDFRSFCSQNSQKENTVRTVYSAKLVKRKEGFYTFQITGNGFLYNMVRIIVGTLFDVGSGKIAPKDIKKIIDAKNRNLAGQTAQAHGLILKKVEY